MNAGTGNPSGITIRKWVWVVVFAAAFAYVESAVVVYLRKIYFDGSFEFPIATLWENGRHVLEPLILVEMGREAATIVMLAAAGILAGASGLQRFCFFMIAFGFWDITPVLISFTMIAAGSILIGLAEKGYAIRWRRVDWVIELGCGLLLIVAFCWDWKNILRVPDGAPYSGIPNSFAWWLFLPAYLFALIYFVVRLRQTIRAGAKSH
jgi:hypothetical protein